MVTKSDVPCDSKWVTTNPSLAALLLGHVNTFWWLDLNGKHLVSEQACSVIKNNCFIERLL